MFEPQCHSLHSPGSNVLLLFFSPRWDDRSSRRPQLPLLPGHSVRAAGCVYPRGGRRWTSAQRTRRRHHRYPTVTLYLACQMFALPSSFSHFPWATSVRSVTMKGAPLSVEACSASEIITADTLNHGVDTQLLILSFQIIYFLSSCPAGFDGAVVCTDCMENSSSYSKDPDYLTHGYGPAGGMEYQQHSHYHPGEQHDVGLHSTLLCNGTPNGIRKDIEEFPRNHNTLQHDRKGKFKVSWEEIYLTCTTSAHKPVPLTETLFFKSPGIWFISGEAMRNNQQFRILCQGKSF